MSIRLLIADDQRLFRQSLRIVLEHESDLKVVGEAGDGQDAYEQAKALRPDMALMDVEMPKPDGRASSRRTVESSGATSVLMAPTRTRAASPRHVATATAHRHAEP